MPINSTQTDDHAKAGRPTTKRPTPPRPTASRPLPKGSGPMHQPRRKHVKSRRKIKNQRLILWAKIILIAFLSISIGIMVWAISTVEADKKGSSWLHELERGNISTAAEKLSVLTSDAVDYVFETDLSPERLVLDFNASLPHLRKAGYVLTELEVGIGIPPKLIPHFYHDPSVTINLDKTLAALEGNSIGTALMLSLAQAGKLQKSLAISDMQFNHIEVELGPIPSLRLQYKNDHAIKDYIHRDRQDDH